MEKKVTKQSNEASSLERQGIVYLVNKKIDHGVEF